MFTECFENIKKIMEFPSGNLEYWSDGVMEKQNTPMLHYSNTPVISYRPTLYILSHSVLN